MGSGPYGVEKCSPRCGPRTQHRQSTEVSLSTQEALQLLDRCWDLLPKDQSMTGGDEKIKRLLFKSEFGMHWDKRHTGRDVGAGGAGKKEKVSGKEGMKNSLCMIRPNTQSISAHVTSLGPDRADPRSSSADTLSACALPSLPVPCRHCLPHALLVLLLPRFICDSLRRPSWPPNLECSLL